MGYHFTLMITMMSVSLNSHYIKSKVKSYKKLCKLIAIWCGFCILVLQLPWVILTMVAIKDFRIHISITVVDSAFVLRSLMFN